LTISADAGAAIRTNVFPVTAESFGRTIALWMRAAERVGFVVAHRWVEQTPRRKRVFVVSTQHSHAEMRTTL
jgi:hypothetical protein